MLHSTTNALGLRIAVLGALAALSGLIAPTGLAATGAKESGVEAPAGGIDLEKPDDGGIEIPSATLRGLAPAAREMRPTYAVRKLQLVALRYDLEGAARYRFDVVLEDDSAMAPAGVAQLLGAIDIGKGAAKGVTVLFRKDAVAVAEPFAKLPQIDDSALAIARPMVTATLPLDGIAITLSKFDVEGKEVHGSLVEESIQIGNVSALATPWFLYPAPRAVVIVCYAGRHTSLRFEEIRQDLATGGIEEDASELGTATIGKAELHGMPGATEVQVGLGAGDKLTVMVQALLGPG